MRFLYCDRILELERGKRGTSVRSVTLADEFLTAHYPKRPLMPASLTLECLAQLAGWLYIVTEQFEVSVVLALVEQVEVIRHARPGETLTVEAWMVYAHHGGATLRGEARIGNETILRVGRLLFASEPAKEEDRDRAKAVFAYISGGFQLGEEAQT